jgi:4-diphosphocytidyl-2-C-methyl-D-erythritol kinase
MKEIILKARAKINLTLDVLGKRPDGYHELEMVMQTIELHDVITIQETAAGIEVTTSLPELSGGEDNIAYRAARLIIDHLGLNKGIKIHIEKNIPLAAGLAGGSTDAAAVLKGLNQLWGLGLTKEQLAEKGALIGSDVPYCVKGGTVLAKGRGEVLTDLPAVPELWMILAKPPVGVTTAEIYGNFVMDRVEKRPSTTGMIEAIKNRNIAGIIANLANVLESVTLIRYPTVLMLKEVMAGAGVPKPLMSGSGPAVFGIAHNHKEACIVAEKLRQELPDMFLRVTRTYPAE